MSTIHVCYAIDKDYSTLCLLSICNLIAHQNEDTNIIIYIICFNEYDVSSVLEFNKIENVEVKIVRVNKKDAVKLEKIASLQKFSKAMYSRWVIPTIKEFQDINRLLYVDADTFALRDLTELYNTDLEGKAFGLCKSQYRMLFEYRPKGIFGDRDPFVNGGVLLFDCKKYNEQNMNKVMFDGFLTQYPYVTDEMIITQSLLEDVKFLPPTANLMYPVLIEKYPYINNIFYWNVLNDTSYKSFESLMRKTDLIHMFGNKINLKIHHKLKRIYYMLEQNYKHFLSTGTINTYTKELDEYIIHV